MKNQTVLSKGMIMYLFECTLFSTEVPGDINARVTVWGPINRPLTRTVYSLSYYDVDFSKTMVANDLFARLAFCDTEESDDEYEVILCIAETTILRTRKYKINKNFTVTGLPVEFKIIADEAKKIANL